MLDLAWQATDLPLPVTAWGSLARTAAMPGTYHYYVHDFRFLALHKHPGQLIASGCRVAVEPNYSTPPGMTGADVRALVRRKRTLAAHWGMAGVKLLVDCNASPRWRSLNLAGVPAGWRAYATRSHRGMGPRGILADFRAAAARAGTDDLFFVVFSGNRAVARLCERRGWLRVPERSDLVRGRC